MSSTSQPSCQIKRLKVWKCGVAQQVALKRPGGAVEGAPGVKKVASVGTPGSPGTFLCIYSSKKKQKNKTKPVFDVSSARGAQQGAPHISLQKPSRARSVQESPTT